MHHSDERDHKRRRGMPWPWLAGIAAVAGVVAWIAWTADGPGPRGTEGVSSVPAEGFPRTLDTPLGPLTISRPPMRIVSCAPEADEMLVELVEPGRIWACTQNAVESTWSFAREPLRRAVPPERRIRFVQEQSDTIVGWQPDLVVVGGFTAPEFRARMRHAGIPVLTLHAPESLAAIRRNIALLGAAVGEDDAAASLIAGMNDRLDAARAAALVGEVEPLTALFVAFYSDEMSTLGRGSTLDIQLELAGYENVARRVLNGPWGPIAFERIAHLDREVGLDVMLFPKAAPANDTRDPVRVSHIERFRRLPGAERIGPLAASPPRVLDVPEAFTMVSSHHIVEGVEWLLAQRHRFE